MIRKKTKIVATIGPATESQEMLEKLLNSGLNVVRMNFSHGDFAEHQKKVDNGRKASKKTGIPIAFLQDLGGPKIRIGEFDTPTGRITLVPGQKFTLTTDKFKGTEEKVHVNYSKLPKEIKVGGNIMLDDGKKRLVVDKISGNEIICTVAVGGEIKGRRGVNLPDAELTISALTAKDKADLEFGVKNKVDFFALSFVRKPEDVLELRKILKAKGSEAAIIAKIETPQAVKNIDEILEVADGIMIARGDLAIEVPAEDVPLIQKTIIKKCNRVGKPVITATQMLESMINSPVPTRAEVSDVANAIFDGTDAIMLSEETTLGKYPIESVSLMTRIAMKIESDYLRKQLLSIDHTDHHDAEIKDALSASAVKIADRVGAKYLVAVTYFGGSAKMLARFKPDQHIFVFTPNQVTYSKLVLSFGCIPVLTKDLSKLPVAMEIVRKYFFKNKLAEKNDKVVLLTGTPFGANIHSNTVIVETL